LNAELQAGLADAIRQLEAETAETITIAGVCYPCTAGDLVRGSLEWFQGGAADMQNVPVNVARDALVTAPAINSLATFRGQSFRIKSVDQGATLWSLSLVQQFA
jgi:hypothetical protein